MRDKQYVIFAEKNLSKETLMMKNIVKLEIIAIMQMNIEGLHIAYLIQKMVHLKKLL